MTKTQLSNLVFLFSGMALACDINIDSDDDGGNDDGTDGGNTSGDDDDDDDDMTTGQDTGTDSGGSIYVCEAYGLFAELCLELDAQTYEDYCFEVLEYAYNAAGLECAAAQEEAFACIALTPCEELSKTTCSDEVAAAQKICGFKPM